MNKKKEPDLSFDRGLGLLWSEGIDFYIDDGYLEIHTVNADSDSFTIILNPDELQRLKDLLMRTS